MRAYAELGREEDLLALAGALEPLSDQLLVVSVRVGGIPVCDPALVYGIKDLERERRGSVVGDLSEVRTTTAYLEALLVRRCGPVVGGEAHSTKSDGQKGRVANLTRSASGRHGRGLACGGSS